MSKFTQTATNSCLRVLRNRNLSITVPCKNSWERKIAHDLADKYNLLHESVEQKHLQKEPATEIVNEWDQKYTKYRTVGELDAWHRMRVMDLIQHRKSQKKAARGVKIWHPCTDTCLSRIYKSSRLPMTICKMIGNYL